MYPFSMLDFIFIRQVAQALLNEISALPKVYPRYVKFMSSPDDHFFVSDKTQIFICSYVHTL